MGFIFSLPTSKDIKVLKYLQKWKQNEKSSSQYAEVKK